MGKKACVFDDGQSDAAVRQWVFRADRRQPQGRGESANLPPRRNSKSIHFTRGNATPRGLGKTEVSSALVWFVHARSRRTPPYIRRNPLKKKTEWFCSALNRREETRGAARNYRPVVRGKINSWRASARGCLLMTSGTRRKNKTDRLRKHCASEITIFSLANVTKARRENITINNIKSVHAWPRVYKHFFLSYMGYTLSLGISKIMRTIIIIRFSLKFFVHVNINMSFFSDSNFITPAWNILLLFTSCGMSVFSMRRLNHFYLVIILLFSSYDYEYEIQVIINCPRSLHIVSQNTAKDVSWYRFVALNTLYYFSFICHYLISPFCLISRSVFD